ncbi:MAG: FN3 associated domain-containing protein, partial [Bacteroidaceae bacterium]|nr:FN3 associated domain-containing protein [Bacteroidaceae bacterium]
MKQFTLKSLLLVLTILMGGVNAAAQTTWSRCTSVDDLLAGGTFIIGYEQSANSGVVIPMHNDGNATTTSAGYLYSGTEDTAGGKSTIDFSSVNETSKYEVVISPSSSVSGAITIRCPQGYVGNANTKNNLKFFVEESSSTAFTPTIAENDVFTLKIASNTSYHSLQYNTGSPRFAVYGGTQKNVVIYKKIEGSISISMPDFSIYGGQFLEAQTVKVKNYSSDYTYYYTIDGTEPSATNGAQYNDEVGIVISASCTLKMIAVDSEGYTSSIASATYTLPEVFSSLEDLVAKDLTSGTLVTVSFTGVPIKEIFVTNAGNR